MLLDPKALNVVTKCVVKKVCSHSTGRKGHIVVCRSACVAVYAKFSFLWPGVEYWPCVISRISYS